MHLHCYSATIVVLVYVILKTYFSDYTVMVIEFKVGS